ncbi:MAG: hypothetical protein FWC19_02870 [Treponema sp.]|nr:hypothetical protein [Treponema sp.]MCL2271732.1 hypothetical protein [Treponema sp.]
MKKYPVIFLLLLTGTLFAQNYNVNIIPRQIYVGDQAVMIVQLPGTDQNKPDIILDVFSPGFPSHELIDFHRIALEQRTGGSRLLIEFTAFAPGIMEFPVIEAGGNYYADLTVTISSLIKNRSSLMLSGYAPALAMPGTALLLYGIIAILVIMILFTAWFILKGRTFLKKLGEKLKYYRLILSIKIMEKQVYLSILRGGEPRNILDKFSQQFRVILSSLTGKNCLSMTANEFENQEYNPVILGKFFRRCDELRFSGIKIDSYEILGLLDDLRSFLRALKEIAALKNAKPALAAE